MIPHNATQSIEWHDRQNSSQHGWRHAYISWATIISSIEKMQIANWLVVKKNKMHLMTIYINRAVGQWVDTIATTHHENKHYLWIILLNYFIRPCITLHYHDLQSSNCRITVLFPTPLAIAKPTSAFLRAGPSFVPSPVTATTSRLGLRRLSMIPFTRVYLSWGEDLAKTRRFSQILSSSSCSTCRTQRNSLLLYEITTEPYNAQ